ncbi:hypothetical protein C5C45_13210 [Rathayibacter rathayi]|uniref:DUF4190 domain-containing protein n=2 Tax=Rathayibacter rathayi TaxID=33887 RepID=A0ABD6W6N9_RATRA|nr:hypothetical protein C5C04_11480 [Rathayibacter rathayi]PPF45190.1 hypothetical protein C5C08_12610 [Rathayibacter rathayi]PPF77701.1 hypothetical protein C5C14_12030 [Rathayibacter rathayi]PPG11568.1 hypothetical protein C5C11_12175 [Rathayibacter rathayi]PPG66427.1 hypothetical protein C5C16_11315 [Rathayibacter rathayi]
MVVNAAGVVFMIMLTINMTAIYADKTKRGLLIGEVVVAIVIAIFVFLPNVALSIVTAIAEVVGQGLKALPGGS